MEISKEDLTTLVFGAMISSGPPVFIFYSQEEDKLYTSLYFHPKRKHDEVVLELKVPFDTPYEEKISKAVSDFKSKKEKREDTLKDILK